MGKSCEVVAVVLNIVIYYSGFVRRSVAKILMDENAWVSIQWAGSMILREVT
jgi:hypothetical protein